MRREEARVFGHAVDEFEGPDVVLLLWLLLPRWLDAHPLVSPLSHGET